MNFPNSLSPRRKTNSLKTSYFLTFPRSFFFALQTRQKKSAIKVKVANSRTSYKYLSETRDLREQCNGVETDYLPFLLLIIIQPRQTYSHYDTLKFSLCLKLKFNISSSYIIRARASAFCFSENNLRTTARVGDSKNFHLSNLRNAFSQMRQRANIRKLIEHK